jgi:hypothetical protein
MDSIALVYAVRRGAKLLVGEDPNRIALARLDAQSAQASHPSQETALCRGVLRQPVRAEADGKATQFLDAHGGFKMDSATLTTSRFTKSVFQQ